MSAGRVSLQERPVRLLVSEGLGPVLVVGLPELLQPCAETLPEWVVHHCCQCHLSPPGSFVPLSLSSTLGVAWGSSPIVSALLIGRLFPLDGLVCWGQNKKYSPYIGNSLKGRDILFAIYYVPCVLPTDS